jgi:hypothetical protein
MNILYYAALSIKTVNILQAADLEKSIDEVRAAAVQRETELLAKIRELQRECDDKTVHETALVSEVEELTNQVCVYLYTLLQYRLVQAEDVYYMYWLFAQS